MEQIVLKNGPYQAVILPEYGANCISLVHIPTGTHLLRTPETEDELRKNPVLFGMPLLFPPNRLADGRFSFEGRTYTFPIAEPERNTSVHGALYKTPFSVDEVSEDRAVLVYQATAEEPYLQFPHAFRIQMEYVLAEDGLTQRMTVINDSKETMPVGIGFHTAFPIAFTPETNAEDVVLQCELGEECPRDPQRFLTIWGEHGSSSVRKDIVEGTYRPASGPLSLQFLRQSGSSICLRDTRTGMGIRYTVSNGFFSWILWRSGDVPFICLEPQSWLVDAPNSPLPHGQTGFWAIPPGGSCQYETHLAFLEDAPE